jgi:hypothetical protein
MTLDQWRTTIHFDLHTHSLLLHRSQEYSPPVPSETIFHLAQANASI